MTNVQKLPGADGRPAGGNILDMQDALDELLAEIGGHGNMLYEMARGDGGCCNELEPPRRAVLRQAGLRIERNLHETKKLIAQIADVAKRAGS